MNDVGSMENGLVARRRLFSSAHFYKQQKFTDAQNKAEFGACYTPHGHGHNYVVEAFVSGPIDPTTRLVVNLADLDVMLDAATSALEHRHLNYDVPELSTLVPTTENIALYLLKKINEELLKFPGLALDRLRLFETDDLWVEVRA